MFAVDLNLAVSARMLTLGVFIPVSGGVGNPFGVCKIFADAISVFTLYWLVRCLGQSLPEFVLVRILASTVRARAVVAALRLIADQVVRLSIFFFNLPFGLVALVMASLLVSDSDGGGNTPFDRENSCWPATPRNSDHSCCRTMSPPIASRGKASYYLSGDLITEVVIRPSEFCAPICLVL